ncbi:adaptor protein complex 3, subunit mu 1 [Blastocystis sp. ATCC 50177/Nand II]|uniref:Adaptor protein complex 3, subunit mu 1 n=1 Tax=Blastocystis sp. subtype 1 (strain ATCC 50177 / NandII) TaxID=478820 RepID=A0A196SJH6_BLAHN|nr:adaptor protein complex 3, subunit mu 1 [Blastocystis sp. ATCC 50177/Nand II]
MIDSLFILGEDKQIVIEKHWKSIVDRSVLEPFFAALSESVDSTNVPPVLESGDYTLIPVKEDNLFFVSAMRSENSPLMVVEFTNKIIALIKAYIGSVTEVKIRSNFSVVYQLLDEVADFGVPVITEPSIMTSLIMMPTMMNKALNFVTKVAGLNEEDTWLPGTTNNNVNWRRPDLKYGHNEIKFFIIEYINATVSSKGKICDCSVYGTLRVQSHLSGMPQVVAAFTGLEGIDGVFLHSCVDRVRYRTSRTLQFVPLDGVFDVMKYSVKGVKAPELNFYCRPSMSWTRGENGVWGTLEVTVGGRPKKNSEGNPVVAEDVRVEILLPASATGANITTSTGKMVFNQEEKKITWVLGNVRKEDMATMKGPVYLAPGATVPKASLMTKLHFVQLESNLSGLSVSKVTAERVKGDYNMSSKVFKQLEAGDYDIQM